jgi:hypothetical protein
MLEKHRSSIYRSLVPILGEEEAEAMVSQFPASDGDELVTKTFLRAEMSELRSELRGEMSELRTEVRGLRSDLVAELYRISSRTIMWLVSTIVAVGGLIVAAVSVLG